MAGLIHIDEKRGRCFIAARDITRGSVIIEEEPYAMVTRAAYSEVCCNYCGKTCINGTVLTLSATDRYRYCSEQCITADYRVHQHEIVALNRLTGETESDATKLIVRIAAYRKLENAASDKTSNTSIVENGSANNFSNIMNLEAASRYMPSASQASLEKAAQKLSIICKLGGLSLSPQEALHLLLSQQCNAHQIMDSDDTPIALGLFPLTSMLNHSCEPNCAHTFSCSPGRPPRLVMRAIRDISAGEECQYNYIPLYASTATRRNSLKPCYSFVCDCPRCTTGGDDMIDQTPAVAPLIDVERKTSSLAAAPPSGTFDELLDSVLLLLRSGSVHASHIIIFRASMLLLRRVFAHPSDLQESQLRSLAGLGLIALGGLTMHCQPRGEPPVFIKEVWQVCRWTAILLSKLESITAELDSADGTLRPSVFGFSATFVTNPIISLLSPPSASDPALLSPALGLIDVQRFALRENEKTIADIASLRSFLEMRAADSIRCFEDVC